jgi:hypothetical protein
MTFRSRLLAAIGLYWLSAIVLSIPSYWGIKWPVVLTLPAVLVLFYWAFLHRCSTCSRRGYGHRDIFVPSGSALCPACGRTMEQYPSI